MCPCTMWEIGFWGLVLSVVVYFLFACFYFVVVNGHVYLFTENNFPKGTIHYISYLSIYPSIHGQQVNRIPLHYMDI